MMLTIQTIYPHGHPAPGPTHVDIEFNTLRRGAKFRVTTFIENRPSHSRHAWELTEAVELSTLACDQLTIAVKKVDKK